MSELQINEQALNHVPCSTSDVMRKTRTASVRCRAKRVALKARTGNCPRWSAELVELCRFVGLLDIANGAPAYGRKFHLYDYEYCDYIFTVGDYHRGERI